MIASDVKVWVATTPVDMQKSFDTLAKVLWRDRKGGAIYYKRLEGVSKELTISMVALLSVVSRWPTTQYGTNAASFCLTLEQSVLSTSRERRNQR